MTYIDKNKTATIVVSKSGDVDYLTTNYASDNACIQAAIDYVSSIGGGKILVREGSYIFTGGINITTDHITLEFNAGAYIINNQNNYAINITRVTRAHAFNNLINVRTECNNTTYPTSKGININKACSVNLYNTDLLNFIEGITLTETNTNEIKGGRIYGHTKGTGTGIKFSDENAAETTIDGIHFGKLENGILSNDTTLFKNTANKILNCFWYNTTNCIQIITGSSWLIEGNFFETSDKGIYINNGGPGVPRFIGITHNHFTLLAGSDNVYIENYGADIWYMWNFNKSAGSDFHISNNASRPVYHIPTAGNITPPAIPATTVNYINKYGYPCQIQIHGGTVTEIDIDDIATGLTSGIFIIPPNGTVNITYSAAPSWRWWGL